MVALALLAGAVTPAYAALGVDSVTPGTITNNVANTLTITGADFDNSAAVLLDGYGALATSFLNNQTLTASVPAGIPAGDYSLRVSTSAGSASWGGTLHVQAPPATDTPVPTKTPPPPAFGRPQLVITSYKTNGYVQAGNEFKVRVDFSNAGNVAALNAQATFSSADLVPTRTGGVIAVGSIPAGGAITASQSFTPIASLAGKNVVVIDVTVSYYDDKGGQFSDKFTLSVGVTGLSSGNVVYATATPTGVNTAQLVITSYATTVDPLQPGEQFELGMTVQNTGNTKAERVTMIVGGGSSGGSEGGTPQPGGTSGGSGEFTNFAPVGASNIQSLGDLPAGGALQVRQSLIVNVSTNPGAYPMKITFSYTNSKGEPVNDDQVITLLVYSLPKLDISFYRDPGPMFAGQPNMLPIQVANLGKRTAVLGNMTIETPNGVIEIPSTLVGAIDQGGYFTFDASLIPDAPGPIEMTVTVSYTDDFNEERQLQGTLAVTVEESMMGPEGDPSMNGAGGGGGGGGMEPIAEPAAESLAHKAWRFILGLFGLDSGSNGGSGGPMPAEGVPSEGVPAPVKPPQGGKG
jgi:hypothetical protein